MGLEFLRISLIGRTIGGNGGISRSRSKAMYRIPKITLSELKDGTDERRRGYRYQVLWRVEGKKRKRMFKHGEKKIAERFREVTERQLTNAGNEHATILDDIEFLTEAARLRERLAIHEVSLTDAVIHFEAFLETQKDLRAISVARLVDEFLASKQRGRGKSERYLKDLRLKLKRFVDAFGPRRRASLLTTADIESWLLSSAPSPVTQAGYFRVVRGLYSFAVKQGYMLESPALKVDRSLFEGGEDDEEKPILTLAQCRRLLELGDEVTMPSIVLGLFCGLRTVEIERMDWSHVLMDRRKVYLPGTVVKKSTKRRYVELPDNAVEWFGPYVRVSGSIRPEDGQAGHADFQRRWVALAREIGLEQWDNHLRHSFASFHYGFFQDIGKTAAALGHTTSATAWKHYRELVSPEDAATFWKLAPSTSLAEKAAQASESMQ